LAKGIGLLGALAWPGPAAPGWPPGLDLPFGRGFHLEQGSDCAPRQGGVPVDLAAAAWGPGFLDTGFRVAGLEAGPPSRRCGPHSLGDGPFARAGAERRDRGWVAAELGPAPVDRYARLAWAGSRPWAGADCTWALEVARDGRPWADPAGAARTAAALRLGRPGPDRAWDLTLLAGRERRDGGAPEPLRPVPPGTDLHAGDGLAADRVYLGAGWRRDDGRGAVGLQACAGVSRLTAWATWTGFWQDPLRGDQRELLDRRVFAGLEGSRRWRDVGPSGRWRHRVGFQARADRVAAAEVWATAARVQLRPLLQGHADLLHGALFAHSGARLGRAWRAWAGLRVDGRFHHARPVRPRAPCPGCPGDRRQLLASPKLGLACRPGPDLEARLEHGRGFRPGRALADPRPMTRAAGTDLAVRARVRGPWVAGLTLWTLDLEAEGVPGPDRLGMPGGPGPGLDPTSAFTAGPRSRRRGLEGYVQASPGPWRLAAGLAWTRAWFPDLPAGRDRVPGALGTSVRLVLGREDGGRSVQVVLGRTGAYALTPDGSVRADPQAALDLRWARSWRDGSVALAWRNAFGWHRAVREFQFVSRLPGEPPGGVAGRHALAAGPQAVRLEVVRRF
jgi:hypothetical protein